MSFVLIKKMTLSGSRHSNGTPPTREDETLDVSNNCTCMAAFDKLKTRLPNFCSFLPRSVNIFTKKILSIRTLSPSLSRQFTMRWEGMAIEELKSIASEYVKEKKGYDLLFSVSRRFHKKLPWCNYRVIQQIAALG